MIRDSTSTTETTPRSHRVKTPGITPRKTQAENPKLQGIESNINMVNVGIIEVKRAKEEAKIKLELRFQEIQK